MGSRYYDWIRINKGFFHTPEIKYVESMQNGEKFILFYMKILLSGVEKGGKLRLSEKMPHTVESLSICTDTEKEIVKEALDVLSDVGLVEILVDRTIVVRKPPSSSRDRSSKEYVEWRNGVFSRDDYSCKMCGASGTKLNAHHIEHWAQRPDKRYDIDNGITLCESCHKKVHRQEGR